MLNHPSRHLAKKYLVESNLGSIDLELINGEMMGFNAAEVGGLENAKEALYEMLILPKVLCAASTSDALNFPPGPPGSVLRGDDQACSSTAPLRSAWNREDTPGKVHVSPSERGAMFECLLMLRYRTGWSCLHCCRRRSAR
eukprot:753198-Hanusia_phi.AAC.3